MTVYPCPTKGASLLLAFQPNSRIFLIIGANTLAASRAFVALEAEAKVVIAAPIPFENACDEIRWRVLQKEMQWVSLDAENDGSDVSHLLDTLTDISLVCVADTLLVESGNRRSAKSAAIIRDACVSRHIPVNVTDMPALCDFTFPSTHRFATRKTNQPSSLQFAVSTNGRGCRLAGRVRRDVVAKLHPGYGDAVENIGRLRSLAKGSEEVEAPADADRDDEVSAPRLNAPVPQLSSELVEEPLEAVSRRMRWVSQVSEYWPIERLASLCEDDMKSILQTTGVPHSQDSLLKTMGRITGAQCSHSSSRNQEPQESQGGDTSRHGVPLLHEARGQIILLGSGPGHPSLLTVAGRKALTQLATRVLSDKLVPAEILALIPPHIPVHIARKFPGNAEAAQNELMEMAVEAARKGDTVIRLKQGDSMLFGRGGEEVLYFRSQGFEAVVVPGISSSLAGPTFAGIPVTQRGVADSLTICTGVGRKGTEVELPGYERSRTLVILMGVARLPQIVKALMGVGADGESRGGGSGLGYPPYLPIAIVERASSPDQRVIASTLDGIIEALDRGGEQRPPGLIIVGWVVLALHGAGDLSILDDSRQAETRESLTLRDLERISRWRKGELIRDGLSTGWEQFL